MKIARVVRVPAADDHHRLDPPQQPLQGPLVLLRRPADRVDEPHVWPTNGFEPVAVQVELVFVRLGLTQLELPIAA